MISPTLNENHVVQNMECDLISFNKQSFLCGRKLPTLYRNSRNNFLGCSSFFSLYIFYVEKMAKCDQNNEVLCLQTVCINMSRLTSKTENVYCENKNSFFLITRNQNRFLLQGVQVLSEKSNLLISET